MERILALAKKDLLLLWRDKSAVFWVLAFPLLLGILMGSIFGGSGQAPASKIAVVDQDGSGESRALVDRLKSSSAVRVYEVSLEEASNRVRRGDLAAYVAIPKGYGEADRAFRAGEKPIKLGADPSRKAEAGMLQGVVAEAAYGGMQERFSDPNKMKQSADAALKDLDRAVDISSTQKEALKSLLAGVEQYARSAPEVGTGGRVGLQGPKIETEDVAPQGTQPASSFEVSFPQALLWGLLAVAATFAVSMVQERERGTLVRLRVSPMTFREILGGKGLACFVAACGVMVALLLVASILFKVRIGSPMLMILAVLAAAVCIVGLMMLLSVLGRTEQAVAGSSWGVLIMMAMFGGGMVPLFLMPGWMQAISNLSPLKWCLVAVEGAIWRGYSFVEMLGPIAMLLLFGVGCFFVGVRVLANQRE